MFKVKYKYDRNPKPEIVYSVHKADDETTEFLMFRYGEWIWRDANLYEPWEDEKKNTNTWPEYRTQVLGTQKGNK